jgi:hypothetical protein
MDQSAAENSLHSANASAVLCAKEVVEPQAEAWDEVVASQRITLAVYLWRRIGAILGDRRGRVIDNPN